MGKVTLRVAHIVNTVQLQRYIPQKQGDSKDDGDDDDNI